MLIPSGRVPATFRRPSLSRRVNANSQRRTMMNENDNKLIKKGEC